MFINVKDKLLLLFLEFEGLDSSSSTILLNCKLLSGQVKYCILVKKEGILDVRFSEKMFTLP